MATSVMSDISAIPGNSNNRSFLPNSSSEPFFGSRNVESENNPKHAADMGTTRNDGTEGSFSEFLPSINFDDFHTTLTNNDLQLSQFPAPGGGQRILPEMGSGTAIGQKGSQTEKIGSKATPVAGGSHPTRSSSLVQRLGSARQNGPRSSDNSMPPPTAPLALRTRRQSQFPTPASASTQNSTPNNTRTPRKSVGPGLFAPPLAGKDAPLRTSPLKSTAGSTGLHRSASSSKANRRVTPANSNPGIGEGLQEPRTPRSVKAKSMHSPTQQISAASLSREPSRSGSVHHPQSPGRLLGHQRTQTPSSSGNKRQSMHASGLGARTISPTDTHRLKRLSMMQDPAAIVGTPPTPLPDYPLPDFSFVDQPTGPSPSMIPRKSVTPSSARATPDPNRKSTGSGVSLSSSSSFSSLRNSGQNRWSQNLSSSRLPTPKPRTVHSSAGVHETEEVPPVPAIPKAYESPKDVPEQPFFDHLDELSKANGSNEDAISRTPLPEAAAGLGTVEFDYAAFEDPPKASAESKKHRRGLTVGTGSDAEKPQPLQTNRRNLQPIRLPPLNLLPLGSSTNHRFDSLPTPSDDVDHRVTTPPPKRTINKTPSTPMTASKAMFPRNEFTDDGLPPSVHFRTNTSHFGISGGSTVNDEYAFSRAMPIANSRQATTPFSSSSLPKSGAQFGRLVSSPDAEVEATESEGHQQDHTSQATQNMQWNIAKTTPAPTQNRQNSLSEQPESPPSGSSLRRKLSARWKRSSSKSSHAAQACDELRSPQAPKHNDMPPPKLPASATWSGPIDLNSSTSSYSRPSLDARRRKSSATTLVAETDAARGPPAKTANGVTGTSAASEQTPGSSRAPSSSIWSLGSRKSINTLRARNLDFNLDKDDLAADEEMKKLASKRKDFEFAAREVDELRKRATPKERVSAAQALNMVNLNLFERGEIIDYREVYFCGTKSAKKVAGDLNAQSANFGYDDERGDYNIVYGDHLSYRYEVVDLLGKGSFGQVVRCVDHKTGQLVAVKIIRNKKRFHQQALVEVNILQKLREWDPHNKHSMINFTQSFYFRGHLCISTELLGMNLYEFIKAHDFKGFSLKLIRRFTKQMLNALVLLKGHRVIHCDLKPENILLAHPLHSEIKVIDFGSSCFENEKVYTYIQSRFYRSPEVILGMSYGLPIDMWSLGCILAELLTGYPIFPGENEQEQLACIMEVFGPPEKHLIEKSVRKKLFFDSMGKPRVTVSSKGRRRRPSSKTLQGTLKCDDEAFLDFLARCLRWDPERRLKPDEALHHDFVTGAKRAPASRHYAPGPRALAHAPAVNGATPSAASSSPVKRLASNSSYQTPSARPRPLPEPPGGTGFKPAASGTTAASRDVSFGSTSSPIKGATGPRRHSTVNGGLQPSVGVKRASNGAAVGAGSISSGSAIGGGVSGGGGGGVGASSVNTSTSSLPRAAGRSASGKPDLASAAAIASLVSRPR
ncbi:MAG: hypothetical protein M1821_006491 [Bathelium mastoideum]|nr:MAG: hypothetical protein M1821_006491 [Bathelium mastoideum]